MAVCAKNFFLCNGVNPSRAWSSTIIICTLTSYKTPSYCSILSPLETQPAQKPYIDSRCVQPISLSPSLLTLFLFFTLAGHCFPISPRLQYQYPLSLSALRTDPARASSTKTSNMTVPNSDTNATRTQLPKGTKHAMTNTMRLNQLVQLLDTMGINLNVKYQYEPPYTQEDITYHRVRYLVNEQPHGWTTEQHRNKISAKEDAAASLVQTIMGHYKIPANYKFSDSS